MKKTFGHEKGFLLRDANHTQAMALALYDVLLPIAAKIEGKDVEALKGDIEKSYQMRLKAILANVPRTGGQTIPS